MKRLRSVRRCHRKRNRPLTPSQKRRSSPPTTADDEQSSDPPAIAPAPRERRAADAPMFVPNLQCPMFCLICGWPNLIELQRDECPLCSSQDCLVPTNCGLAVRCQRSGRDIDNVPVYVAGVRDLVSKRFANIVLRNSKWRQEVTLLRDPRDSQGEGPKRRSVGLTAGSGELRFGSHWPLRSRSPLFVGTCSS